MNFIEYQFFKMKLKECLSFVSKLVLKSVYEKKINLYLNINIQKCMFTHIKQNHQINAIKGNIYLPVLF